MLNTVLGFNRVLFPLPASLPYHDLVVASGGSQQVTSEPNDLTDVVVVLVDTLRADHMSTYGYARPTLPYIDVFAADAVVFEHGRSQSSCTFPSVNSLMTSRYPGVLALQGKGQFEIRNSKLKRGWAALPTPQSLSR